MQIRVPGELAATIRKQAKADQRTIHPDSAGPAAVGHREGQERRRQVSVMCVFWFSSKHAEWYAKLNWMRLNRSKMLLRGFRIT